MQSIYLIPSGVEATLTEKDIKATATIAFSGCIDCTYTVEAMCTKVFVQGCKNFTLNLRGKVGSESP